MEEDKSLLNKIRSKYILKKILTIAYGDMKSVLKLTKYNKSLMEKIDINMKKYKDYYQYEFYIKSNKNTFCLNYFFLIKDIIIFIFLLIFIILYKKNEILLLELVIGKRKFCSYYERLYFIYIFYICFCFYFS